MNMSRTPLMGRLRMLARIAAESQRSGVPAAELLDMPRRRFMQAAAGGLALTTLAAGCANTQLKSSGKPGQRVAIIGAGIAGLHCAHLLKKGGIDADVYEAADRVGGRMFTKRDLLNPGQTVELGGSFIDSTHADMLSLCNEFELDLLDMRDDASVKQCTYFFGDRHYTDREVLEWLKPHVERMAMDSAVLDAESDERFGVLDRTSIRDYLTAIGAETSLRKLLEVAFVTEYGLDADEQSALNMLCLIGLDSLPDRWETFGESDERYKVKGGNQQVTDRLALGLEDRIQTARKLEAIAADGSAYELTFSGGRHVTADYVVLALPFTLLREVDIRVELPKEKRIAIDELGYGTNAKLLLGMSSRPWREQSYGGNIFTDQDFQLAWDNSRLQPGMSGGITLYSGGKPGVAVGENTPREQIARLMPGLEKAYPGSKWAYSGRHFRMHWPSHAFTKASYACYRPGQWSSIAGHEIEPVGNLLFAGEHCSSDFQGYMNGGAETGRVAAESILAAVKKG
ncbi:MAG: FAD-dependent oxidoreductase [Planctomycetes bacterium]|nr:FAD-dependent oxidoreductase [Planctomycetota bacterium]